MPYIKRWSPKSCLHEARHTIEKLATPDHKITRWDDEIIKHIIFYIYNTKYNNKLPLRSTCTITTISFMWAFSMVSMGIDLSSMVLPCLWDFFFSSYLWAMLMLSFSARAPLVFQSLAKSTWLILGERPHLGHSPCNILCWISLKIFTISGVGISSNTWHAI